MTQAPSIASSNEQKRVVICCDQLAPTELIRDALRLGKALNAAGHVVVYLVADPISLVEQAGSWTPCELHQAPILRAPPHLVMRRSPPDGLADLMALSGFDERHTLVTIALLWHSQLALLRPDVIVGFCSPVLWLIGPLHAPTFALGNGYCLPPILDTSFPRLSADSTPLADEMAMLSNANAVLARLGKPAIAELSEILERCKSIVYSYPAFDPYLRLRQARTVGLLGDRPPPSLPPAEKRIAAFLDAHCPNIETIVLAIAGIADAISVDLCIIGGTTGMRRYLEEQNQVKVWRDYESLLENSARAGALIHHGVQDVAEYSVALGRPQLIVPWTRDQETFNYVIGWMGLSWSKPPSVPIEEMSCTIRDLLENPALAVAAQYHARQLASLDLPDAVPRIVSQIRETWHSVDSRHGTLPTQ